MKTTKLCLWMSAIASLVGACSVKNKEVVNEPPTVKTGLVKHDVEFGAMKIDSVTLFYWPVGLTEEQAQVVVRTVNTASGKIDEAYEDIARAVVRTKTLEKEFETDECVENWAASPDDVFDWVEEWKTVENTDPDFATKSVALNKCVANQDERKVIEKQIDGYRAQVATNGAVVYKTIDPGYPTKVENQKSVNAKASHVVIKVGAAPEIELVDFMRTGNKQSTEIKGAGQIQGASYNVVTKLLTFMVPELGVDGQPTGAQIEFALERGPNTVGVDAKGSLISMARFKGDMKLVKDGQVLRYGTASIQGKIESTALN